jgi:hypothetical protein
MSPAPTNHAPAVADRRRAAVRTAWIVAAIAIGVYVAFILSGVLAS